MISPELLRRYPFFAGLSEDQLRGIAMIADEISFPAKTIVFKEDTEAECFYILVSGEVELLYSGGGEGRVVNAYVGSVAPGEVFGFSSLLEPYKMTTAARSEGPVSVIAIDACGLRAMCEVDHRLGYTLMQHLAQALAERLHGVRIQLAVAKPI